MLIGSKKIEALIKVNQAKRIQKANEKPIDLHEKTDATSTAALQNKNASNLDHKGQEVLDHVAHLPVVGLVKLGEEEKIKIKCLKYVYISKGDQTQDWPMSLFCWFPSMKEMFNLAILHSGGWIKMYLRQRSCDEKNSLHF